MRIAVPASAACLALFWSLCAAQPANMSGSWRLNTEKSKWGTANRPVSVIVTIDHHEPSLNYQGVVLYPNEDERSFTFAGNFDGKPYPMSRSFGEGMITLTRVDNFTVESVFRTNDGSHSEVARTILSRDGRTLTRQLRVSAPDGVTKWTEVYEKQ